MIAAHDDSLTGARYKKIPATGIYLPNATRCGFGLYSAHAGDVVSYRETRTDGSEQRRLARVLDLVTHSHDGKEYRVPTKGTRTKAAPLLRVLALDDMCAHAFERWIDVSDVAECRAPSLPAFVAWALCGPMPSPETIMAASRYGTLSDLYFADACNERGALDDSWRARSDASHERKIKEARERAARTV